MKRLFTVITGQDGRARIGTISWPPERFQSIAQEPKAKSTRERAPPHHPKAVTLVLVTRGSHTIFAAGDGNQEQWVELDQGDWILFLDFLPGNPPPGNLRFSYSGHWSEAGISGATLLPHFVQGDIPPLEEMDWREGTDS